MQVILRTHGGLGNQLFQVLYGRLFAEKFRLNLVEIHDSHYKHAFQRSNELLHSMEPLTLSQTVLSSMRIPKILHRLFGRSESAVWIFGNAYLDGYFQGADSYSIFDLKSIERQLDVLAAQLLIKPANKDQCLVHLRVGDFFKSRNEAKEHVLQRLATVVFSSLIMTNDEELMADPTVMELLASKKCTLVSTLGFSAEKVLRMMATYRQLDANDSTLVFWASVLGGSNADIRNEGLRATRALFANIFLRKVQ